MRNAIGFLIVLAGLKIFFSTAFATFDATASQIVQTIGTAAAVSEKHLQKIP